MITKTYNNFYNAINAVRAISHSLSDSIGHSEIDTPEQLREILRKNQEYYHTAIEKFNEEIGERTYEYPSLEIILEENPSSYWTGGGTTFEWSIADNGETTVTLYHADGWHRNSRLLANAYFEGFDVGKLPFRYSREDANVVKSAEKVVRVLQDLNAHHYLTFAEICERIRKDGELMVVQECITRELVSRAIKQGRIEGKEYYADEEDTPEWNDGRYDSDDDLLGESTLKKLRGSKLKFADGE